MERPVILTADSTCDLSKELAGRYNVTLMPVHITYGETCYNDGEDIHSDDLFKRFNESGELPKTAAVNTAEYIDFFRKLLERGYDVLHIGLGSAISSCYANAVIAKESLEPKDTGRIFLVNSRNLSTGSGLLVIEAAERIAAGMPIEQAAREVSALSENVRASFVLENLRFMAVGGRCSGIAAFGANLLSLKVSIRVDHASGSMAVDKKYRGKMDKVLPQYVDDMLSEQENIDTKRVFITHSGVDDNIINQVRQSIESLVHFDEILVTRAGCTISSHCGPGTLGVLFMTI